MVLIGLLLLPLAALLMRMAISRVREYAADEGHSEAMLAVGRYYDPTHKGPSGTIRKDPATAYEWYREALKGGLGEAEVQLAQLRRWVESQAGEGSSEARALLEVWQ